MAQKAVAGLRNVRVDRIDGLLVNYVRRKGATVIVRGLRAVSDFEFEFQLALMNRKLDSRIETIFLMTKDEYCGIKLVSVSPGHAVAKMQLQPWHLNAVGSAQGGAIFTLADFAFAAASNAHGTVAVGINVSITYLKGVQSGVLTAEAREVGLNPKLGSYTVDIRDETSALIAVFQGLVYRKSESLESVVQRGS